MRLLLDTHALLWWAHEPDELSGRVKEALEDADNDVFASAVSAVEIALKARIGKLEYDTPLSRRFSTEVLGLGFMPLSVTCDHAELGGSLPGRHKDPWDRLLVAQAQQEQLTLVTKDSKLADYNVAMLW